MQIFSIINFSKKFVYSISPVYIKRGKEILYYVFLSNYITILQLYHNLLTGILYFFYQNHEKASWKYLYYN